MTNDALATGRATTDPGRPASVSSGIARDELRMWAILAISSLGIAGAFALMVALSRVPGLQSILPWPVNFFNKGLVIHVVFSLVVWFLSVFALLVSIATFELSSGAYSVRFSALGRVGSRLVALSFPLFFVPAFFDGSVASLNNYVPVIIHPYYYGGLIVFAVGILLPVLRLFLNLRPGVIQERVFPLAMIYGSGLYLVALVCFVAALWQSWGIPPTRAFNEQLFWGGGHILQFLNCLMMLTGWIVLLRASVGQNAVDTRLFRIAAAILLIFVLPTPMLYLMFDPYSGIQQEAFRRLQFVFSLPVLLVAISGLSAVLAYRSARALPWRNPAFLSVVLSVAVFIAGGIMGLLINDQDTRTPAHYHAVIAAVNLSCMGLVVCYCLPRIGRPVALDHWVRRSLVLFGGGQLAASIGLFMAGGYGAPRKVPDGDVVLVDGAIVGLYMNGVGALVAVIGGVMFIVIVARALMASEALSGA